MLRPLFVLAALTLLPATLEEAPALEWTAGSALTRTLAFNLELVLEDASVIVDGEEMDAPLLDVVQTIEGSETLIDTPIEVEDGRAVLLSRTFESTGLSVAVEAEGEPDETDQETDLDGRTVLFRYDADDEEYSVEYSEDDADGDEDALEELVFDIDLRQLLPEDDVEEGDTWSIDPELLSYLTDPGGGLSYEDDEEEEDQGREAAMEEMYDNVDGDFEMTYIGEIEEDDRTLFVVGLAVDVEGSTSWEEEIDTSDAPFEIEGMKETTVTMAFELEGELAWDTSTGHLIRLDIEGEVTIVEDEVRTFESEQFSGVQQKILEFVGELTQTLRTE